MSEGIQWATVHGSTAGDQLSYNDGMRANSIIDDGNYRIGWELNDAATAEMTLETGGAPAEAPAGGMVMNSIPKEGGNTFAGTYFTHYGSGSLQSDNRTPELKQRLGVTNRLGYSIDTNPAFGGPIKKNKLWFFGSFRYKFDKNYVTNQFFKTGALGFGHDGEQAFNNSFAISGVARVTHQLNPKNKWRISFERLNRNCEFCDVSATNPPESGDYIPQPVGYHAQARWSATVTNRLLLGAGFSTQYNKWRRHGHPEVAGQPYYYELTTGVTHGSWSVRGWQPEQRRAVKGTATYVTGSHNIKTGVDATGGYIDTGNEYAGDVRTAYLSNGVPVALEVLSTPLGTFREEINAEVGVFVQDLYNLFNAHTTTTLNAVSGNGQQWQQITAIFRPRFIRLGLEVDF
jgi:hypothetical protein